MRVKIPNNPNRALFFTEAFGRLNKTCALMRKMYKKTRIESFYKFYNHQAEVIKIRIQKHKQEKWQKFCSGLNSHQIYETKL